MNQTVHAADVDERAKVGQAAHDTVNHVPTSSLSQISAFFLASSAIRTSLREATMRLFLLVHFDNLELHVLAHEVLDLLDVALAQVRRGDESLNAHHGSDQTALNGLLANSVNVLASLCPAIMASQLRLLTMFFWDRITLPSPSLTFTTSTSDFIADLNVGGWKARTS